MNIQLKEVTVREITENYSETKEGAVFGYNGKLNIRPAYQREFVYKDKQRNAVIDTVFRNFPLNTMYWSKNEDGTYEVLDGQQRTISLCNFVDGISSFNAPWFNGDKKSYIHTIERVDPDLAEKLKEELSLLINEVE